MTTPPWLKQKAVTIIIVLVILYFLANFISSTLGISVLNNQKMISPQIGYAPSRSISKSEGISNPSLMNSMSDAAINYEAPPQPGGSDRMVISESNLSLLVKDVRSARDQVIGKANEYGGYMVNSNLSNPGEAPSGTLVVRVKSDKLEDFLSFLRTLSIKVVSENLTGYDVTDQYVDIEKRIAILEKTKAQFENILNQANEISDITNLTSQIMNVQSQIDNYKGQQLSLSQNADLARVTIYLSTDEIALPYAPSDTWRPNVIFKLAVRSLIMDLRGLAEKGIWLGVYAVVWIPLLTIGYLIWKFFLSRRFQNK